MMVPCQTTNANVSDNSHRRERIKVSIQEADKHTIGRHEYILWVVRRVSNCDAIHSIYKWGKKFIFIHINHISMQMKE